MQFGWQTNCQQEFENETCHVTLRFYFWEFVSLVQQEYISSRFLPLLETVQLACAVDSA